MFNAWCSSNLSHLGHPSLTLNVSSSGMSSPRSEGLTSTDLGLASEIQNWRRLVQGITSLYLLNFCGFLLKFDVDTLSDDISMEVAY